MPILLTPVRPSQLLELAPSTRRWLPTDAWVRALLVPVVAFIALASNTAYLADFWHHLARGRTIVTEGALLDHDVFTFTVAGETFHDVNWLSQTAYFLLFDVGGLALVRVVNALVMALALGLLVRLCFRLCGSRGAALAVGIAVFLGSWQVLTIRPQTFSLLLFVVLYDLLDRCERHPLVLCIAPFILAVWANLHGAFPAGLMLIGCFLAEAMVRAWRIGGAAPRKHAVLLALCLGAALLATLANPYGWHIYIYVALTSNRAAARGIDEWAPPSLDQGVGIAFFISLIVLGALIAAFWKRHGRAGAEAQPGEWAAIPWSRCVILALCFLPLAAGSVRMVVWWLFVMAPMGAMLLASLLPRPRISETTPSVGAGITCGVLLLLAVFSVPGLHGYNPLLAFRPEDRVERDLDEAIAPLLHDKGPRRIFTRFEWGEYVTWAADRRLLVFMDGRIEIYPDQVWSDYRALTTGRDWAKVLDAYEVDVLILDHDYHARTGLLEKVDGSPVWSRSTEMGRVVVYFRIL